MVFQQLASFFQRQGKNEYYDEHSVEEVRQYILSCPDVTKDSPFIQAALGNLEKSALRRKASKKHDDSERRGRSQVHAHGKPRKRKNTEDNKKNGIVTNGNEAMSVSHSNSTDHNKRNTHTQQKFPKPKRKQSLVGRVCKYFFLYSPLMVIFMIFVSTVSLHHIVNEYLDPQLDLMVWDDDRREAEATYYDRECTKEDMTAFSAKELLIPNSFSTKDCLDHMMTHGMSMYPDILQPDTADRLRSFVLRRNKKLTEKEAIPVIDNNKRWSFGIGANDDPIVSEALQQIATHDTLRPALEKIVGINPAVIEMTAITSAFGAGDQFWHADVLSSASALAYSRSFVPSYSLFITLQDTTEEMGATQVCPGTYMCTNSGAQFCAENGFPVSGKHAVWKKGYGALVNQQSQHRGAAHTDPDAPHRVVFILTFAPRPEEIGERRMLGQGGSYSTRWDMWGHTLEDFKNPKKTLAQPWAMLRSLGIYKPAKSQWGWDYISVQSMRIANEDTGFTRNDLDKFIKKGGFGFPSWLHPKLHLESSWDNYLYESMLLFEYFSAAIYAILLFFYLLATMAIAVKRQKNSSPTQQIRSLGKMLAPLFACHICIVIIAFSSIHRVSNSQWAKDIKANRLYRPLLSWKPNEATNTQILATPRSSDILIGTRFSSKFLASFNQVLDYHPGNILLKEKIALLKVKGTKFQNLPRSIQDQLVERGMQSISVHENREFLYQNESGKWELLENESIKKKVRDALFFQDNPLSKALMEEIEYLKSDCRFGYMYLSAWCRRFSPEHIASIQQNILNRMIKPDDSIILKAPRTVDRNRKKLNDYFFLSNNPNRPEIASAFMILDSRGTGIKSKKGISNLPSRKNDSEHFKFIKGDIVEGQYRGYRNEWYKGKIIRVNHGPVYDVQYVDGDFDLGLQEASVRQYVPYEVGEVIQFSLPEEDFFEHGKILEINDDMLVVLRYDGVILETNERKIRRYDWDWEVGNKVATLFRGSGTHWYQGTIQEYHYDEDTFDILYDDGDIEYNVEAELIFYPWEKGFH